jgi:hypothetical protein
MENQPFTQPQVTQQMPLQPQQTNNTSKPKRSYVAIFLLVIVAVAAIAGTYVWQHSKVTSLQDKLNSAKASTSKASANDATAQPYLYLYSYGVKIPLSKDIEDLYYIDWKNSDNDVLSFSTQSLSNAEPSCLPVPLNQYTYSYELFKVGTTSPQTSLGTDLFGAITVTNKALPTSQIGKSDEDTGIFIVKANGYYFYYKQSQGTCLATDSSGNVISQNDSNLASQQVSSFLAALKNASPIN